MRTLTVLAGRYVYALVCCFYLFTVGWLRGRNRALMAAICFGVVSLSVPSIFGCNMWPPREEDLMLKRAFTVMAVAAALVFGASTLFSEVSAARPCPAPGCPVISCPPCSILICDPGRCRMHCQLDPN